MKHLRVRRHGLDEVLAFVLADPVEARVRQGLQASLHPPSRLDNVPPFGGQPSERRVGLDGVRIQIERTPVAVRGRLEALEEAQDVSVPHVKAGIVGILRETSLVVAESVATTISLN